MINIRSNLEKRFNAFSFREKILVLVAILVSSGFVWYTSVYGYFLASNEEINKRSLEIKSQLGILENQIGNIGKILGRDTTAELIEQEKTLKIENEQLKQKVYDATKRMISTKDMSTILNELVATSANLTFTNIESLETKPLFSEQKLLDQNNKKILFQVYSHGLKIEMLGNYFATLQFLKRLEQHNANLIWNEIDYEVKKYPEAKIVIILHTLNLEEGWIDV